ncbi:programmed cell death 1 ligand 1-like [Solea senegalensis]|uniref:Programmed cell death 1 ligand 1-like n=2 Tax=Solea senegalensis TaxID=28829 RepID=A0AAV6R4W9_SOLSE|nr:uncharacterized protein LOC122787079 [Solea senegalensis]KAG7499659.1 programmed cell death 1 ligand 1-like [Solea senegalensis]
MNWAIFLIVQVIFQPCLSDLFTVEAEQNMYESVFGGDVVMGCSFRPKTSGRSGDLQVTWHWIGPGFNREVYIWKNGKGHSASQEYQDRATLLTEQLSEGWAKLQLSKLKIRDSGKYQCLVRTAEGADYKTIILSVVAPYQAVTKHIEKAAEGDDLLLTCQSEGYPQSTVVWKDGRQRTLVPNTTAASTSDQLFKVTSQIRVSSSDKNNYTCVFTKDGHSATFHLPDEIPIQHVRNDTVPVILLVGVVLVAIAVMVAVCQRQRKGSNASSTRNLVVDARGRWFPASTCLQINTEDEEERTIFNENCMEENLGVFLKARYSEVKHQWPTFNLEELPHTLQNNEGQSVNLQALLPEAGEVRFLEGPPGSGKTTVAYILVSSWTEGATDILDLSSLRLLIYVDCSAVKGDLFREIMTQVSLEKQTEDELRMTLTKSKEALLLLDGYKEGNQMFDESLKRFLSERGGCRVLITAFPGSCPALREAFRTGVVLKLQTRTVNYKR